MTIPAIHLLVEQTLNAMMEFVLACLNIKAMPIEVVDLNAFSILIARETKLALEINALILALEPVDKMQFAM
jgi:hypothetical protein